MSKKEREVACISGKDKVIVNPIIDWLNNDVWEFLNVVMQVPHCELYDPPYNQHRVGCILCPMSSYKEKIAHKKLYPYVYEKWVQVAEKLIRGGVLPRVETTVTELWDRRRSIAGETGSQLPPPPRRRCY